MNRQRIEQPDNVESVSVAPVDRSLRLDMSWRLNRFAWGATWSFICGAVAAWHGLSSPREIALPVVAWFVVVPLWGSLWTDPALGRTRVEPGRERQAFPLFAVVLVFSLALLLGGASLMVGAILLAFALRMRGGEPKREQILRSINEILVPMLFAWLVLGGPRAVPPGLAFALEPWEHALAWLRLNWLWPVIALGSTCAFHGASAANTLVGLHGRSLVAIGYVSILLALALADRPIASFLVAAIFVLHWPYQAELQRGRSLWYFQATQGLAMLTMVTAAIGAALFV